MGCGPGRGHSLPPICCVRDTPATPCLHTLAVYRGDCARARRPAAAHVTPRVVGSSSATMWAPMRSTNSIANRALKANVAMEMANRDSTFRRTMQEQKKEARGALAKTEFQELYSQEAMDARCTIRHEQMVLQSLRAWARTLEAHELKRTEMLMASVTETMYSTVLVKVTLAITAIPTIDEVVNAVRDDWADDSRGARAISFEAFKDAIFQVADIWTVSTQSSEYSEFLDQLLEHVSSFDGGFRDDAAIRRGVARPPGFAEDPNAIARREEKERLRAAEERHQAALRIQRLQRKKQRAEEQARLEAEYEAAAVRKRAAAERRRQQELELQLALQAAGAAGEAGRLGKAAAERALRLKQAAEHSDVRRRMRSLGLLPSLVSPRMQGRKLYVEDALIMDATPWMDDGEFDYEKATTSLVEAEPPPPLTHSMERVELIRALREAGVFRSHARDILNRASFANVHDASTSGSPPGGSETSSPRPNIVQKPWLPVSPRPYPLSLAQPVTVGQPAVGALSPRARRQRTAATKALPDLFPWGAFFRAAEEMGPSPSTTGVPTGGKHPITWSLPTPPDAQGRVGGRRAFRIVPLPSRQRPGPGGAPHSPAPPRSELL